MRSTAFHHHMNKHYYLTLYFSGHCPLSQVAGTTGRIQQDLHNEEEEGISAEAHGQAIVEALGLDK